jgi:Flp pilus assembly protein TadB
MHVSTTAIGLKMGCDRVAVASLTGFGLGLCTCVLLTVPREERERKRERERGRERKREREREEERGRERRGSFQTSLSAWKRKSKLHVRLVPVRLVCELKLALVGRVQEDRGPLS